MAMSPINDTMPPWSSQTRSESTWHSIVMLYYSIQHRASLPDENVRGNLWIRQANISIE